MLTPRQKVVDDWKGLSLKEFAERALQILKTDPRFDEVVLPADSIKELEKDHMTPPTRIYALPEGFEYYFSGFYGQILGVRREGPWGKY